jgi:type I restriction enzyme R subunit
MKADVSEKGLERLICTVLTGNLCDLASTSSASDISDSRTSYGGNGWLPGNPADYEREYAIDLAHLNAFLKTTQPKTAKTLDLANDSPTRRKFLARLQGEISKSGVIHVLRNGLMHGPNQIEFFYGTPSSGNKAASERYAQNRFSVTRQLRYSRDETQLALDLCLFINGLPVITFELKNRYRRNSAIQG